MAPGERTLCSLALAAVPKSILLFLVACIVTLSACEVALDVDIDVEEDGSGQVELQLTLDDEALAQGPEDLAGILRTGDLADAGWRIEGPSTVDDSTTINARKGFGNETQLQDVLDEIAGPNSMFKGFRIERASEFASTSYSIDGAIDLRSGEALFNDEVTAALFDGNPLGKPLAEYIGERTLDDVVPVTVRVSLPGEGSENSRSDAVFSPRFDDANETRVSLSTVDDNFIARVLRWVAIAAGALCALATVLALLGMFLDRRALRSGARTPEPMAARVPMVPGAAPYNPQMQPMPVQAPMRAQPVAAARGAAPVAAAPAQPAPSNLRNVIIEPIGVLYDVPDEPEQMMANLAQDSGSNRERDEIVNLYHDVTTGRLTAAEFWEACGLSDADELNVEWIRRFRPRSGAAEFLREMRRRQIVVSALTNDGAEWSQMLQERDNLGVIKPWITSGSVGGRKPDPGIYEALRREIGVGYEQCLYVDTVSDHLDAGRTLGMKTTFMKSRRPAPSDRPNHPVVSSFGDFFKRR